MPLTLIQWQYGDVQRGSTPGAAAPMLQSTLTGRSGVAYWNPLHAPQPTALQAWTRMPYCWPLVSPPNTYERSLDDGSPPGSMSRW